jgi:hypothetical protein
VEELRLLRALPKAKIAEHEMKRNAELSPDGLEVSVTEDEGPY